MIMRILKDGLFHRLAIIGVLIIGFFGEDQILRSLNFVWMLLASVVWVVFLYVIAGTIALIGNTIEAKADGLLAEEMRHGKFGYVVSFIILGLPYLIYRACKSE